MEDSSGATRSSLKQDDVEQHRFTSAVVYQGLVMRLGIVSGSLYTDFFISAVVEVPAAVLILLSIDRIGRRLPFALSNLVAAVACLITAALPEDVLWLKIFIATLGRLGITMAFEIVYFVNTEIYPTSLRYKVWIKPLTPLLHLLVELHSDAHLQLEEMGHLLEEIETHDGFQKRNFGVSMCSGMCDLGGIIAPFLLFRLAAVWLELPLIIFGILAFICAGLVMLLPETMGIPLPETIEDVENLSRSHKCGKEKTKDVSTHI